MDRRPRVCSVDVRKDKTLCQFQRSYTYSEISLNKTSGKWAAVKRPRPASKQRERCVLAHTGRRMVLHKCADSNTSSVKKTDYLAGRPAHSCGRPLSIEKSVDRFRVRSQDVPQE